MYDAYCPVCGGDMGKNGFKKNGKQNWKCKVCKSESVNPVRGMDFDIITENVRLEKNNQKVRDKNRIANKSWREYARIDNAVSEYNKQLVSLLSEYSFSTEIPVHSKITQDRKVGIVQLSDLHLNELVDLEHNKFDFGVASKRLKLMATKTINYFKTFNVHSILVALTGDILNSDRRLDELLNMATNRAKATFLAVSLLEQMILELTQYFNVTVASVSGNESRVGKDVGWSNVIATDNYDYTIHNILMHLFRDTNVKFSNPDTNYKEQLVEVNGHNILLLHGYSLPAQSLEKAIQQLKGKYAAKGVKVGFIIFGHLHSCRISDTFARSSSLVGSNAFSDNALQLESMASQNVHIIHNNGEVDSLKLGLQWADTDGYAIEKALEAYNAKSLAKTKVTKTIVEVVV